MKIKAYAVRPDEFKAFEEYGKKFGHEVSIEAKSITPETVELAKGFEGVTFLGNCTVNREVLQKLSEYGIRYIASRSAGVNNIDFKAAKEFGIKVSNVPAYSPNAVSEFAVTLAMCLLRNLPQALKRANVQNFGLSGLIGREIRNQTVGVIGVGKIGKEVAKAYKGFGAKVIGYDAFENEEAKEYLTYHTLEEVFELADVISFHCPLTVENYHLINKETIKKMKEGVIIINTARGGLIDAEALLEGLYSGKIAGAALDVYENEVGILHRDCTNLTIKDMIFNQLRSFQNVIITPHCAFYTDEAVANMVEYSLESLKLFEDNGESKCEVR